MNQINRGLFARLFHRCIPAFPFALLLLSVMLFVPCETAADPFQEEDDGGIDGFAHVYIAQFSANRFNQIVRLDTEFRSSWLAAVGVGRKFLDLGENAQLEWELQAAQHFGRQSHQEVNGLLAARWSAFPWDGIVDTSIAFGSGLSYAFEPPRLEETPDRPPARTLKFMLLEMTATPAHWEDWTLFTRIHHRSGVFDILSEARGSNFVGIGVRRHF